MSSTKMSSVRTYSYDFIQTLNKSFSAILDDEIVSRLLEIKRTNRFVRRKSPMRLKYKIKDSVALQWRKEREEQQNQTSIERYELAIQSSLNKLSHKNYSVILETIVASVKECVEVEGEEVAIQTVVNMLFEKASKEKTYSELYAQILSDLQKTGYTYIGQYVREHAQHMYSTLVATRIADCRADMDDEEIREVFKSKMKFTGLFFFIANMFVHGLLTYTEVKQYYDGLLSYFELSPVEYCDTYIDSICQMARLSGYLLEKSAESKERFHTDFMAILMTYQETKHEDNPKMSNKNRFAIMDVTDLYRRGWDMNRVEEIPETVSPSEREFKKKRRERRK